MSHLSPSEGLQRHAESIVWHSTFTALDWLGWLVTSASARLNETEHSHYFPIQPRTTSALCCCSFGLSLCRVSTASDRGQTFEGSIAKSVCRNFENETTLFWVQTAHRMALLPLEEVWNCKVNMGKPTVPESEICLWIFFWVTLRMQSLYSRALYCILLTNTSWANWTMQFVWSMLVWHMVVVFTSRTTAKDIQHTSECY